MTEVRFYHLQKTRLPTALSELLEKCWGRGWRAVVQATAEERVEALAEHLWSYRDDAFLPHGSRKDGFAEHQPIWITDWDEVPNGADVLFLVDGAETTDLQRFRLVCDVFDGADPAAVEAARGRWRRVKADGHTLAYWQQTERGRWEEKMRVDPEA